MLYRLPFGLNVLAKRDPGQGWTFCVQRLITVTYTKGWQQWALTATRPGGNWIALYCNRGRLHIDSRERQRKLRYR